MTTVIPLRSNDASLTLSQAGEDIDFDRRFGGIARLYGKPALDHFQRARVCVIGVGGVGSWVVEALARSAVGNITMIDLDNVAESNINRQIHALTDTLGKAKVTALTERIAQINPYCRVTEIEDFITADNIAGMIGSGNFDYVVDAIDDVRAKTALIAYCREQGIRLITIGGAGGQTDPTRIEIRDLNRTEHEPLLAKVRKRLRAHHGFPRGEKPKYGIDAVFSTEPLLFPESAEACDIGNSVTGLNCAGFGSSVVVTASFGLVAASHVLRKLAAEASAQPDSLPEPAGVAL
ncbi:tRNA A37 threonylcarbamoyladenosine dehydratase [Noviherbaspirillum humi]|uniref:tRNA A37 threonylcarbamoyladenosine dehydratase n=1 Tax=Noviherbaspirillum humi TaxID=1688639 RepID=A0A239E0I3_9BURK|nr:tRNA cyclic N6-threonylcarbamoyladenosine(37) synthase TcdA [Noviherbaspirillum humi]SNS38107.1 tRNA A37 threonylcarbamoyladenosine dehydratase [Noviherbaspirillum humi]